MAKDQNQRVYTYTGLINDISAKTGVKKAYVRRSLESLQELGANFLRANPGGRVHVGRFGTLHSRMTSERAVNNPRKPGERVTSPAHLVIRFDPGTHTKKFLQGGSWVQVQDDDPADPNK